MNAELATATYPLHLNLDLCQPLGGWSQMMHQLAGTRGSRTGIHAENRLLWQPVGNCSLSWVM